MCYCKCNFPYEPFYPSVGWLVGYTLMLLSEHLLTALLPINDKYTSAHLGFVVHSDFYYFKNLLSFLYRTSEKEGRETEKGMYLDDLISGQVSLINLP